MTTITPPDYDYKKSEWCSFLLSTEQSFLSSYRYHNSYQYQREHRNKIILISTCIMVIITIHIVIIVPHDEIKKCDGIISNTFWTVLTCTKDILPANRVRETSVLVLVMQTFCKHCDTLILQHRLYSIAEWLFVILSFISSQIVPETHIISIVDNMNYIHTWWKPTLEMGNSLFTQITERA